MSVLLQILDRDVTVTDVAPSRRSHPAASSGQQQVGRSDTLKRQEMEKDDEVAPLGARQVSPNPVVLAD